MRRAPKGTPRGSVGRRTTAALAALGMAAAAGCSRAEAREVTLVDGATTTRFVVKSAFAEYVELPGVRNELHVTLASYASSCERWVPPHEGDTAVTLVIVTPADKPPTVASYGWTGVPGGEGPLATAYALPKAQVGLRSRLFEPGGTVRLSAVQLEPRGTVSGTLALEFPGEGERPATRIDGSFDAKMCRMSLSRR